MRQLFASLLLVLSVAAGSVLAAAGCGPSELSKAYDSYSVAVSPRLDAEAKFWDQIAARAAEQEDAAGVGRYRAFLQEKAAPYYATFETELAALTPGHQRLATAHEQVVAYARSRREFVDLELRRIDLGAQTAALMAVQSAQEAAEEARAAYVTAVGDDVPDYRFATLNAAKDDFLNGTYRRAVDGSGDVAEAVERLRKVLLPQLRELRDGRYDDSPQSKAFRRCVVATEEFFVRLADHLPAIVDTVRSATRSAAVQREADAHRTNFQKQLAEAKRDR